MALKVLYDDKVALNSNAGIPDINKVKDLDMNNIKSFLLSGWNLIEGVTFTFSSWDSTVSTLVVTTNYDLTPYVGLGDKLKYTHSSTTKYAIVTAITSTTMTLYLGTDYIVASGNITNVYFSKVKNPLGFPMNPDKWSVIVKNTNSLSQNSPATNTWYNIGSLSINVPIGQWNLGYFLALGGYKASSTSFGADSTLSTSASSESDKDFHGTTYIEASTATLVLIGNIYKSKNIMVTSKTPYYLIGQSNGTAITFYGNISPIKLFAVCAYL